MKLPFAICIAAFIVAGCVKHSQEEEAPVLTASIAFLKPTSGDIFHKGDSINIQAFVTAAQELHGFDLLIRKAGDASSYFFTHIHDHGDTIRVNQSWLDTLSSPANLEAELTIYLDHELHTQKATIGFKSQ